MIGENEEHIKFSAQPILNKTKSELIKKEMARIELLQRKRASMMLPEWHNEIDILTKQHESLETDLFVKSFSATSTASQADINDTKEQLKQVNSRLSRAQDVFNDLRKDALEVNEQFKAQFHEDCLHECIDDLDSEIQRSKLRIQELNLPLYATAPKSNKN
eukprot:scaffold248547_cov81-Cyclotella_meneghiniana.AAC.1